MADSPPHRRPSRNPTGRPDLDQIVEDLKRCDAELAETVVEARVVHHGRYMNFERQTVEMPDGRVSQRDLVFHPGAVAILALDNEERLLLVRQYRLAPGGALLEVPAGTLDREADGMEDPTRAAHRELEEETGYRAGKMERLGGFFSSPGFTSEYITLFLATELQPANQDRLKPDEDERLELFRLPWRTAVAAVEAGVIEDAKSAAGIMWLANRMSGPR